MQANKTQISQYILLIEQRLLLNLLEQKYHQDFCKGILVCVYEKGKINLHAKEKHSNLKCLYSSLLRVRIQQIGVQNSFNVLLQI